MSRRNDPKLPKGVRRLVRSLEAQGWTYHNDGGSHNHYVRSPAGQRVPLSVSKQSDYRSFKNTLAILKRNGWNQDVSI